MSVETTRKLTEQQVLAMRKEYKESRGRHGIVSELAVKYGIQPNTVQGIVTRRTWKHVGGYR